MSMGMVAREVREDHIATDRELSRIEREYRQAGLEAAACLVHGARVLLEKARRLAGDGARLAAFARN